MKKKEFKVGEVFQCGFVKLKVERVNNISCSACFFKHICNSMGINTRNLVSIKGECCEEFRDDKTDVIFVEVEE